MCRSRSKSCQADEIIADDCELASPRVCSFLKVSSFLLYFSIRINTLTSGISMKESTCSSHLWNRAQIVIPKKKEITLKLSSMHLLIQPKNLLIQPKKSTVLACNKKWTEIAKRILAQIENWHARNTQDSSIWISEDPISKNCQMN